MEKFRPQPLEKQGQILEEVKKNREKSQITGEESESSEGDKRENGLPRLTITDLWKMAFGEERVFVFNRTVEDLEKLLQNASQKGKGTFYCTKISPGPHGFEVVVRRGKRGKPPLPEIF